LSRTEIKSGSLQIHNSFLRLPEEYTTALQSAGYPCKQMNILPQNSNAEKGGDKVLLESAARSGERLESLKSACRPLQYK